MNKEYNPESALGQAQQAIENSTQTFEQRLRNIKVARRMARPGNNAEALEKMHTEKLAAEFFETMVADHFEWCEDCGTSKEAFHHELNTLIN